MRQPRSRTRRFDQAGFSLIEVMVGLAILATIAAVITPNLAASLDKARVDRGIASLENLSRAVEEFETDVKRYPGKLSQLATPLGPDDRDSCGYAYPPGLAAMWAGPYLSRLVPASGLPIAIGVVSNDLARVDRHTDMLVASVPRVAYEDAVEVNRRVDGDESLQLNSIRASAADADGLVTLLYVMPVKQC